MSDGKTQLEQAKNSVQKSEKLQEKEKKLITQDFLHELRNGENINSDYTFAKHVRKLKHISEYNDWLIHQVEPSKQVSKEIRNQIQSSAYKKNKSQYSEYSKKNKNDHWTAWKYFLKHIHGIQDPVHSNVLPPASFSSKEENVDKQASTDPKDLPNRDQFRKLLKTMKQNGKTKVADRNTAFFALLWDTGTRAGEALNIRMKDVEIRDGNLYIDRIKGNKKSNDRVNRIFQCEELLKQYYLNHPADKNSDQFFFPKTYYDEYNQHISSSQLSDVMRQAKASASLNFKDYGEPLHIFRKAMSTFLVVNDILDWETVCARQGKKEDSTKPDYILRAEEDRELIEAQGFGVETEESQDDNKQNKGHMINDPLMPQNCTQCGRTNNCLKDLCVECGGELELSSLPKDETGTDEELVEKRAKFEELLNMAENLGIDTDQL